MLYYYIERTSTFCRDEDKAIEVMLVMSHFGSLVPMLCQLSTDGVLHVPELYCPVLAEGADALETETWHQQRKF